MQILKNWFLITSIFLASTSAANATSYNLTPDSLAYNNATLLTGTLETSQVGTFTSEAGIESFLNSATYSVTFYDGANQLFNLNNSNSSWDLVFGFEPGPQTTSASLIVDSQAMTLGFNTPAETTEVRLFLRSPTAFIGTLQYSQSNNVTNDTGYGADFNAISRASSALNYGSLIVMPALAAPVPESSTSLLLLGGLGMFGFFSRKHRKFN